MNKLVSIIIVNWNGKHFLEKCIPSLSSLSYAPHEIIVVDNNSGDGSVEFLEKSYPEIIIVKNQKNLGFAEANNIGYQYTSGEYILLLNNDTYVAPGFLEFLVETLQGDKNIAVVEPKILLWDKKETIQVAGSFLLRSGFLYHYGWNKDEKLFSQKEYIFSACGACMLIKKEVIERVGLFDPDYFAYMEETDFCWRVWLLGYTIVFDPRAVIFHKGGGTASLMGNATLNYLSVRNRIWTLIKNLSLPQLFLFLPFCLLVIFSFASFLLWKRFFHDSFGIFRGLGSAFWGIPKMLKKRKYVQKNIRKISDKKLFEHILQKVKISYYYCLGRGWVDRYPESIPISPLNKYDSES